MNSSLYYHQTKLYQTLLFMRNMKNHLTTGGLWAILLTWSRSTFVTFTSLSKASITPVLWCRNKKKKTRVTTKIKYMYTVCIKSLPPLSQRYAQPFIQNKLKSPSPNQSCIFIILLYYLPLETDMALHLKKKWKSLQPRTI